MYVRPNFKTKAALKRALLAGETVTVFSPGSWPCSMDGVETVEGPHYPEPHRWYARVQVADGRVIKVIS
jgi:hypothetical protein